MPDQSSAATEHALLQEITAPLERLPADPLALVDARFPSVRLGGYDRSAVDDYVTQTRQLVAELQATRTPEAAVRQALERVGDQISGILQRAHETAESITAQSRSEAEDRLEQARREAAGLISVAEERVRELDADADRIWGERQRIVDDAQALAAQLGSVATEAAERFPEPGEPDAASAVGSAPGVPREIPQAERTLPYEPLLVEPVDRTSDATDVAGSDQPSRSPGSPGSRGPRTHFVPPGTEAGQHRHETS